MEIVSNSKDVTANDLLHKHKLFDFWRQISPITLFVLISFKKILDKFLETNQNNFINKWIILLKSEKWTEFHFLKWKKLLQLGTYFKKQLCYVIPNLFLQNQTFNFGHLKQNIFKSKNYIHHISSSSLPNFTEISGVY